MNIKQLFYKNKSTIILVVVCACILITGILVMIAVHNNATAEQTPSLEAGNVGTLCVLPGASVTVITEYTCGHIKEQTTDIYTGYTRDMLESINGCTIEEMNANNVIIKIASSEYCPEHYILILVSEDSLCVFSTADNDKKQIMEIPIDTELISIYEYSRLREGIIFENLEDINLYLEGIET